MGNLASKKGLIIGTVLALVVAGGAAAFFILNKTPKQQYFLAEYKTVERTMELFQEKYENEFTWYDKTKTDQTEAAMELTGVAGDSLAELFGSEIIEVIENSSLTLTTQADMKKGEIAANFDATIMDIELTDFKLFMDAKKMMVSLPFLQDTIALNDADFGKVMRTLDPSYEGSETLGLDQYVGKNALLSDEMVTYLQKEYLLEFYNQLPDEAFTESEKEAIQVSDSKLDAKKITMKLTEQQIRDVLIHILEKAKDDKKLDEMIKALYEQGTGLAVTTLDVSFAEEVDAAIDDMITSIENADIPEGLTSEIWLDGKYIIKRNFTTNINDIAIVMDGTQLLNDDRQLIDYQIGDGTENIRINADLSWKDNKALDTVTFAVNDQEFLEYSGDEVLKGDTRTFTRMITSTSEFSNFLFDWSGEATHDKDQMIADHHFTVIAEEEELVTLNLHQTGKLIKEVTFDEGDSVVNIGELDEAQLTDYMNNELPAQAENWLNERMMEFEELFYY